MKRSDIGFAGALGALAGLSVAIVSEWELLPTLISALVGIVVAGVSYRPLEIPMVVWNACRTLPSALQHMPQKFQARKEKLQKALGTILWAIGCIALGVLSFLAIPVLLSLADILPHITDNRGQYIGVGGAVFLTGSLSMVIGAAVFLYLIVVGNVESPLWAWRMGKMFEKHFKDEGTVEQRNTKPTKGEVLLACLWAPILLQCMSIGLIMMLLDALSTLLLALASTERVAAILGAVLGWGTGVLLHMLGVPGALVLLAIGTIVGWFAGPLLYRLRKYLAAVPATATS